MPGILPEDIIPTQSVFLFNFFVKRKSFCHGLEVHTNKGEFSNINMMQNESAIAENMEFSQAVKDVQHCRLYRPEFPCETGSSVHLYLILHE